MFKSLLYKASKINLINQTLKKRMNMIKKSFSSLTIVGNTKLDILETEVIKFNNANNNT